MSNFTKFLVDAFGNVVERFAPKESPTSPKVKRAVERLLAQRGA